MGWVAGAIFCAYANDSTANRAMAAGSHTKVDLGINSYCHAFMVKRSADKSQSHQALEWVLACKVVTRESRMSAVLITRTVMSRLLLSCTPACLTTTYSFCVTGLFLWRSPVYIHLVIGFCCYNAVPFSALTLIMSDVLSNFIVIIVIVVVVVTLFVQLQV